MALIFFPRLTIDIFIPQLVYFQSEGSSINNNPSSELVHDNVLAII